jgi:lysophospholipase L1-like esterase
MLNEEGTPVKELFIEDGLHMSKAGYDLWANEIKKYIQ